MYSIRPAFRSHLPGSAVIDTLVCLYYGSLNQLSTVSSHFYYLILLISTETMKLNMFSIVL
jgi:hypothetical protein